MPARHTEQLTGGWSDGCAPTVQSDSKCGGWALSRPLSWVDARFRVCLLCMAYRRLCAGQAASFAVAIFRYFGVHPVGVKFAGASGSMFVCGRLRQRFLRKHVHGWFKTPAP